MLPIATDALTYDALSRLVGAGLQEDRGLDFKRDAIGRKDDDKREFVADVSAFANTIGGDILIGIDEVGGVATDMPGIDLADPDAEKLRLEEIVRASLDPRLPRFELKWLTPPTGKFGVLVCRVPQSYKGPHRVASRGRFYGRNSAGKFEMDTAQLRSAFVNADTIVDRIRRFRTERLNLIEAGEAVLPMTEGPLAVLHLVPIEAMAGRSNVTVGVYDPFPSPPSWSSMAGGSQLYTLDGFATYRGENIDDFTTTRRDHAAGYRATTYALLMRSGAIEATWDISGRDPKVLPLSHLEWPILSKFHSYLETLKRHRVEPPYYVFLSLLRVRGCRHLIGEHNISRHAYQRDRLILPEILIETNDVKTFPTLRPLYDILYNAFGWERAANFDEDDEDKYTGPRL